MMRSRASHTLDRHLPELPCSPGAPSERKGVAMSTVSTNGPKTALPVTSAPTYSADERSDRGAGWVVFAAIMFMLTASLNIIWGLAALAESSFFVGDARYIISDLNTWGWITMGFGALGL